MSDWCLRCRVPLNEAATWCKGCHAQVMSELHARISLPPGHDTQWWKQRPKPGTPRKEGEPSTKDCIEVIKWMSRQVRCSGAPAIWKDDPSGASSSWDMIVRQYEELGEIIL